MMTGDRSFLRWLVLAALLDWLVTRSLARLAIFMPKSPIILAAYQGVVAFGQAASVLCSILALLAIGGLAWQLRRSGDRLASLALAGLALLSLASLLAAPSGWMQVGFHALLIGLVVWFIRVAWNNSASLAARAAALMPGLALLAGELYQAIQALYTAMGWAGPAPYAIGLFNLGEALVLLSPAAIWWLHRRDTASRWVFVWAALPALAFAVFYWLNPAMAGILAVWSAGLTLYLPWPAYMLSLWLAVASLLILKKKGHPAAWALLLLAAGGYAPQLSSQAFLGLIALWLLGLTEGILAEIGEQPISEISQKLPVRVEVNS